MSNLTFRDIKGSETLGNPFRGSRFLIDGIYLGYLGKDDIDKSLLFYSSKLEDATCKYKVYKTEDGKIAVEPYNNKLNTIFKPDLFTTVNFSPRSARRLPRRALSAQRLSKKNTAIKKRCSTTIKKLLKLRSMLTKGAEEMQKKQHEKNKEKRACYVELFDLKKSYPDKKENIKQQQKKCEEYEKLIDPSKAANDEFMKLNNTAIKMNIQNPDICKIVPPYFIDDPLWDTF